VHCRPRDVSHIFFFFEFNFIDRTHRSLGYWSCYDSKYMRGRYTLSGTTSERGICEKWGAHSGDFRHGSRDMGKKVTKLLTRHLPVKGAEEAVSGARWNSPNFLLPSSVPKMYSMLRWSPTSSTPSSRLPRLQPFDLHPCCYRIDTFPFASNFPCSWRTQSLRPKTRRSPTSHLPASKARKTAGPLAGSTRRSQPLANRPSVSHY